MRNRINLNLNELSSLSEGGGGCHREMSNFYSLPYSQPQSSFSRSSDQNAYPYSPLVSSQITSSYPTNLSHSSTSSPTQLSESANFQQQASSAHSPYSSASAHSSSSTTRKANEYRSSGGGVSSSLSQTISSHTSIPSITRSRESSALQRVNETREADESIRVVVR